MENKQLNKIKICEFNKLPTRFIKVHWAQSFPDTVEVAVCSVWINFFALFYHIKAYDFMLLQFRTKVTLTTRKMI